MANDLERSNTSTNCENDNNVIANNCHQEIISQFETTRNDISSTCQYCCCHFPDFVGSAFKTNSTHETSTDSTTHDLTYKPYFELENEEEQVWYEYFKLLARATYDEVAVKHREQALEELHQSRLSSLLEELRIIEGIDFLDSSSDDECFSTFRIKLPEKRRSLRLKNKRKTFQRQKIRK